MEFTVKLAEVNIRIISIYDEVFVLCKDYITDEPPAFSVKTGKSDIDFEREKSRREAAYEHRPYIDFADSYLETLAVYRKIAVQLLNYGVFLMHGAVVGLDGKAYLFTAPSGVGKTTHTQFWLQTFQNAFIINGDKPLLKYKNGTVYAFGSPWAGKEAQNRNTSLPLCAICALTRGKENIIKPIDFNQIYPLLISQVYRPTDKENLEKTMRYIKDLSKSVKFYLLRCNLDKNAANVAYDGMNNK